MKMKFSTLKSLLAFVCLSALLVLAVPLRAQVPIQAPQTLISSYTLGPLLNTNLTAYYDCSRQSIACIQISQAFMGTGTSNVVYGFRRTVDGTLFDSTEFTVSVAGNGATAVTVITNLPLLGATGIRLSSITNWHGTAGSGIVTNLSVVANFKSGAP